MIIISETVQEKNQNPDFFVFHTQYWDCGNISCISIFIDLWQNWNFFSGHIGKTGRLHCQQNFENHKPGIRRPRWHLFYHLHFLQLAIVATFISPTSTLCLYYNSNFHALFILQRYYYRKSCSLTSAHYRQRNEDSLHFARFDLAISKLHSRAAIRVRESGQRNFWCKRTMDRLRRDCGLWAYWYTEPKVRCLLMKFS